MLYQICNGAVRFAAETILEHINFEIRDKEKIAVVGRNGCGKTTLLKLISGEVELSKRDSDEDIFIAKAGKPEIGYLKQITFENDKITLDEEIRKVFRPILKMQEELNKMLEMMNESPTEKLIQQYTALQEKFEDLGGYYYEKEYMMLLKKFGFNEEERSKLLSEFSGGQRTKIAFIKLLLSKPDILLLDEPTNHLDISTIEWLESYLKTYNRAVVIVSHDRMFLDKIVDVVYEIEYMTAKRYSGNYSDFVKQKKENWEKQEKDYNLQKKEIQRLTTIVDKFKNKPTKVAMTRSKQKQIEHMDKIEAPERYDIRSFRTHFEPKRTTGKEVLRVSGLEIGYDRVLSEVTCQVTKGQKVAIIGGNGLGKSTFLKTLVGQLQPLGGEFSFGYQVDTGYFDQQMAQYTSDKTVLNEFWDEFPTMTQTEVRSALGAFLFMQDEVFKQVSMLSGGEKGRLALAKILRYRPNFLILDEPTNHMDIIGKESLEAMLKAFPGAVLFVSHDRYFVKQVADALLIFEEGKVTYYPYSYDEYLEECQRKAILETQGEKVGQSKDLIQESEEKKAYNNPGKEQAKKERKIKKVEEQIEIMETEVSELQEELLKPEYATDYVKLSTLQEAIVQKEVQLEQLMKEWDELLHAFNQ